MNKIWVFTLSLFLWTLHIKAQKIPVYTWKDLAAALAAVDKDSTLSDSCRGRILRFRSLIVRRTAEEPNGKTRQQLREAQSEFVKAIARDSCDYSPIRPLMAAFTGLLADTPVEKPAATPQDTKPTPQDSKSTSRATQPASTAPKSLPPARIDAISDTVETNLLKQEALSLRQSTRLLTILLLLLHVLTAAGFWWLGKAYSKKSGIQPSSPAPAPELAPVVALAPETPVVLIPAPPAVAFICEMLMTAGPRKKFMNEENADKDLGEDVCGCVMHANKISLWLLDGTSDQFCLKHPITRKEYFSSRLLAQCIGERLRAVFAGKGTGEYALDQVMQEAIEGVRMDWVRGLRELPEEERSILRNNIQEKNSPECASTLLVACLSLKGELSAYRSGDSKMLLFRNGTDRGGLIPFTTSFTSKNPESNDRIFFRIVLGDKEELDILCNRPGYELLQQKEISSLIAFSDGIGPVTEQALNQDYAADPDGIRRRIITQSQGTADDKSICLIRVVEN
jgi:hypothetical protein